MELTLQKYHVTGVLTNLRAGILRLKIFFLEGKWIKYSQIQKNKNVRQKKIAKPQCFRDFFNRKNLDLNS